MGSFLKFLFCILLALIILVIVVPLLWLFIKEVGGLFGGSTLVADGQFGWFVLAIVSIVLLLWLLSRD